MSDLTQTRLLTTLGIVTATITVAVQVMSVGEIKGKLETVLDNHSRQLDSHEAKIDENTRDISEIKGKLTRVAVGDTKK